MPEERNIHPSRPLAYGAPEILVGGKKINRNLRIGLVEICKKANKIPYARIEFPVIGRPGEGSPVKEFIPGIDVEIKSKVGQDVKVLFKGIVNKHRVKISGRGNVVHIVECNDSVAKMTAKRNSRSFSNMKDSEIWEEIVRSYDGIGIWADGTGVNHSTMVQYDCSDWNFIVARAYANGKLCFADDGKLTVGTPDFNQSPVMTLASGSDILELEAETDDDHLPDKVIAQGWDPAEQKMIQVKGKEPGGGLNERVAEPAESGSDEYVLNQGGNMGEQELQAWSDAFLLKRKLAKIRGKVKCKGTPDVKPGQIVDLKGVGKPFDGKVYVTGIQHTVNKEGWLTDIQFGAAPDLYGAGSALYEPPEAGVLPPVSGLQIGKVVQVYGDPEGEGRILIKLPVVTEGGEGIWCRQAGMDAGNERGLVFRPEIGDEVIVGFINNDPRQAIALGMMHSSSRPTPLQPETNNGLKGLVTRSGIRLIFDDEHTSVSLKTPAGKKLTIDDDAAEVTISDEMQNRIVMGSKGILLFSNKDIELNASGDIKLSGVNISGKADALLQMEGTAKTSVSASGVLVLKGSVVQIN